jgi:hypothetical protein
MQNRLNNQAGIAIGPILFVVAILAILATAIAAGSSTFATNASQETNRTNAGSMLQIGSSLKMGFDRLIALGNPIANVDINASNTTSNNAIFSPTGGGLVPPSTALSNAPGTDNWIYTWGNINGLGTTNNERLALLKVTPGVCDQINTQGGITYTLAAIDFGGFSNTVNLANAGSWPSALNQKLVGCFQSSGTGVVGNYFFQVLAVQ